MDWKLIFVIERKCNTRTVAEEVETYPYRDGVEPGTEGPFGIIAGERAVGTNKGLLGDIIGVGQTACHTVSDIEDRALIALDQFSKCLSIALRCSPCQFPIVV